MASSLLLAKLRRNFRPRVAVRGAPGIVRKETVRSWTIQRFIITIEGHGWQDFEDVELLRLPDEGEPIETKYGTCYVTQADALPKAEHYDGKIVARLP